MRELWDTFRGLLNLHTVRFHGEVTITFVDGIVTFTRTNSGRKPAELPGDDGTLAEFLAKAHAVSADDAGTDPR